MNSTALYPNQSTSSAPFNSVYSVPPGESLSFADRQSIAENEVAADALETIDRSLARRLRSCRRGSRCRARKYCALCGPIQADQFGRRFGPKLLKLANSSHLTLTTRACPVLTRKGLDALKENFDRLRERKRFKQAVWGGVVNYQIEHRASGWLLHLHAILDQKGALSRSWTKKTWTDLGGGWAVKLQTITPGTQPVVLIYGARKPNLALDSNLLRQFHAATAGFVSIRPWGTLHPLYGVKPRLGGYLGRTQ
ncbi:MAG: hypothetical protein A2516_01240 [Alphaproteobacteria bacterium RIFOXYD12_FULL_60_8]|nr:MAG: hypothetical protein A2516_01240 [Alphaproteobacteria bacterium RIFOXYD12_FULL_60_8]